ncbi:MAG: copper resistance system multicopper oxidase [Pseudomonadota bacterium]
MTSNTLISRRGFVRGATCAGMHLALPLPAWASSRSEVGQTYNHETDLTIGATPVTLDGRRATATGINGSVPGPLLRWREGDTVSIRVRNELKETSSIHWHGLLLPSDMDGVPGLSFSGITPGDAYHYEFRLRQNGTYWYHSHSDFQEQTGVYGPIIIEPKDGDPVEFDRDFVVLLSDWTFIDPNRIMNNLKVRDDYYNYNRRTLSEFFADAKRNGLAATTNDRRMWGAMRMKASDIADITAATYTYLLNGFDPEQNWTGQFAPGERVRLRLINGSAQTFFNVRVPGLEMTVVQADGQNVRPVTVDELQLGVAETMDVIVTPGEGAYTLFAETMDRSGFARGTLTSERGLQAAVPELRDPPRVTMRDMGMGHDMPGDADMGHGGMQHGHAGHDIGTPKVAHNHRRGPGVANVVDYPSNRLDEPGQGLANVGHRVLRYSQLRSLDVNDDEREPGRELEIHLTGNMERYMWSFDGVKFSEVEGPIRFVYGERLRVVLVNDTMMSHPIHLHGMFFELVNGNGRHNPRKHTVVVKPAERLAFDVTADELGHWAFHCHMLYHMKAGMMQTVLVTDDAEVS